MAVDLIDYVPTLRREIEPPGTDVFSGVTDAQWVGYLADAFWEARLDGFLEGYETDTGVGADIAIVPIQSGAVDMDRRGIALIVLYAGVKVLRNRILNMSAGFRAKAGPVEFEQESASASVLAEMLRQLKQTKDRIIEDLDSLQSDVLLLDAYSTRLYSPVSYHGAFELTEGNM